MTQRYDVVIVGGGHGDAQTAITLRQHKLAGSIAIVGQEPTLPYERPPLSKDYLARKKTREALFVRSAAFWAHRSIHILPGRRVTGVEPHAKAIVTSEGEKLEYGTLVWAAGGHARRLSCRGHDLKGVHYVRTAADVDRVHDDLRPGARVAIVGGGYIGLEVAATLSGLGHAVTLVEALDRVLARVTGQEISRFLEAEHVARGVDVRLSAKIEAIENAGGCASAVRLTTGECIGADVIIIGIGIIPEISALTMAGAKVSNGVQVDEFCRTSLPDIFAIGDCALHANSYAGGEFIRLESVQNANDMALTVSRSIVGSPEPYRALPWFWSNQYDLRLQTVGLSAGHTETVIRGSPASKSFSVAYLRDSRVLSLDCINAPRDFMHGRLLIERQTCIPAEILEDCSQSLKQIAEHSPRPLHAIIQGR
jgi:3-phenylpropionate/trans-cinnamate dioxygenase ferredoxin reductase component